MTGGRPGTAPAPPPVRRLGRTPLRAPPLAVLAALVVASSPAAQEPGRVPVRGEVFVGTEVEDYLRVLQVAGHAPAYPWSLRSFSPAEVDRLLPADSAHPWAGRYDLRRGTAARGFGLVRPDVRVVFNSAFPHGSNDGAVWAGRGATAAVRAGFHARWRGVSLTVAPTVFVAQNAAFDLRANGRTGEQAFADGDNPGTIDLPQRFGDGRYARVDPGQSTLRAGLGPLALGVSTADQHWGPAVEHPLVLGSNAGGFPHAFVGTSRPLGVGLGRLHGRVVWGVLEQSAHATVRGDSSRRVMSGLVVVFTPRGIDGLELGATRFFHVSRPAFERGDLLQPFEGLLKSSLGRSGEGADSISSPDNQLASAFARWVFPASGVEVYGEYGREDHSRDLRDLLLEPDHASAYTLGFRKVWPRRDDSWLALRAEVMNARVGPLEQARGQARFYVHTRTRQGHTLRGQALGSAAAYGGAGSTVALERYGPGGRWSVAWTRALRGEATGTAAAGVPADERLDVVHAVVAEALLFRRGVDVTLGAGGVYEVNRDYRRDAFNLHATLGVTAPLR